MNSCSSLDLVLFELFLGVGLDLDFMGFGDNVYLMFVKKFKIGNIFLILLRYFMSLNVLYV